MCVVRGKWQCVACLGLCQCGLHRSLRVACRESECRTQGLQAICLGPCEAIRLYVPIWMSLNMCLFSFHWTRACYVIGYLADTGQAVQYGRCRPCAWLAWRTWPLLRRWSRQPSPAAWHGWLRGSSSSCLAAWTWSRQCTGRGRPPRPHPPATPDPKWCNRWRTAARPAAVWSSQRRRRAGCAGCG